MKNSEAKAVLERMRGFEGSRIKFVLTSRELHCSSPWVSYASIHNHATLDGETFTADELEAIVAYMRDPKGVSLGVDSSKAGGMITFDEAWKLKEAQGYRYGRDALEQVSFGYEIALEQMQAEQEKTNAEAKA